MMFFLIFSAILALSRTDSIQLNSSSQMTLSYSFPKNDTIRFSLESYTQGYVGMGFGYQMAGTNIILSYQENGVFVVKDTTAFGHEVPIDNANQNVVLISGSRDSLKTTFVFERLLNTGDSNDYTIVPFSNTPLIWSSGASDTLVVHTNYGLTSVVFQQCDSSCLTCTGASASNCASCDSNHNLVNGYCVSSTIQCDSSCLTCTGSSSSSCASCDSTHTLVNGSCILKCDSSCFTCSGTISSCTSCPSHFYLQNDQCFGCDASCLECQGNGPNQCLSCSNTSILLLNNTCQINLICDSSCLSCSGSTSSCTGCSSQFYLQNNQCFECDASCLECNGSGPNQCLSCSNTSAILINNTCQNNQCPLSCNTSVCLLCNGNYSFQNGQCVLDSINILTDLTSEIQVTNDFYLYWRFNSNDTITMAFRWRTGGFIGLGFGTAMNGMDVISAEYVNGQLMVFDRWADSTSTPNLDTDIGGTDDVNLIASLNSDSEGFAIVKFNRALNTGDRFDYVITQKSVEFCFAYSDLQEISYHGNNKYLFSFQFFEGYKGQAVLDAIGKSNLIQAHGIGLLIGWSFLVDISLIIVRYFKNMKYYVEIHSTIFLVLDVFTLDIVFMVIAESI